jgi:hypothetical protein
MMIETLAPTVLILSGITAGLIVVIVDTRIRLVLLAIQYICVAILVSISVPIHIGAIKCIVGIIVVCIMTITYRTREFKDVSITGRGLPSGWIFRIIAVLLVSTSAVGMGGVAYLQIPGIHTISIAGAILLMGLGLLQLGMTERPLGVGIGLFTLISGFEIIYSSLEPSLAMMGLLASIHIGIAISVSILEIDVRSKQESEVFE